MLGKKVKKRIIFFIIVISFSLLTAFIVLKSLEENLVYFFSPTDIYNKSNLNFEKKIRVGGLVKKDSVKKVNGSINFIITDLKNDIIVSYKGLLPNLFAEEKGVVAEGKLKDKKYFIASKILAKHDENYMPPEVAESLKKVND